MLKIELRTDRYGVMKMLEDVLGKENSHDFKCKYCNKNIPNPEEDEDGFAKVVRVEANIMATYPDIWWYCSAECFEKEIESITILRDDSHFFKNRMQDILSREYSHLSQGEREKIIELMEQDERIDEEIADMLKKAAEDYIRRGMVVE